MKVSTTIKNTIDKSKKCWKQADPNTWRQFNSKLQQKANNNNITTADELTETILWTLNKTIEKKTIGSNPTIKESKEVKNARSLKKQARKQFDEACKQNTNKSAALDKYKKAQLSLKNTLQKRKCYYN